MINRKIARKGELIWLCSLAPGVLQEALLSIMGLALVSVLLLIMSSAYQYFQFPKEPAAAQKFPSKEIKEINLGDFKTLLIEREKQINQAENKKNLPGLRLGEKPASLLFSKEALAIRQCSVDFAKAIGASIEEMDSPTQKQEELRSLIEDMAKDPLRGEPWAKAAVIFVCKTLADPSIITMKKEGKIGTVIMPTLYFHLQAWDKIDEDRLKFERKENYRVASERADEQLRVTTAKASAFSLLIGAASAFALFMMLALYLLGARIENNLRSINESIRGKGQ